MPQASLVNKWAGLLLCLQIWENSTRLNSWEIDITLYSTAAIEAGGGEASLRAFTIPTSHIRAQSHEWACPLQTEDQTQKALASISTAPNGAIIFLLHAPTTLPLVSLIKTPNPVAFYAANIASSMLILYLPCCGGCHFGCSFVCATVGFSQ